MAHGKIRVGIIGAGRIANLVHVPSLKLCAEMCEVLGVASRVEEKAVALSAQWAIPRVYPDWRVLLGDPQIDAVVICLPSGLTTTVATAAIAAWKHILCEKPLGLNSTQTDELRAAAGRAGASTWWPFFRFVPALPSPRLSPGHFGDPPLAVSHS
jgi:predicted dehydrogenase